MHDIVHFSPHLSTCFRTLCKAPDSTSSLCCPIITTTCSSLLHSRITCEFASYFRIVLNSCNPDVLSSSVRDQTFSSATFSSVVGLVCSITDPKAMCAARHHCLVWTACVSAWYLSCYADRYNGIQFPALT